MNSTARFRHRLLRVAFLVAMAARVGAPCADAADVLLIVINSGSLTTQEGSRKSTLESWGHTVSLLSASSSQASYDAATAANDVVYVCEEITATDVNYKLRETSIGVVSEEMTLDDEFGFATSQGFVQSANSIDVIDNSHSITSSFSTGSLQVTSSSADLTSMQGSIAAGGQVLANISSVPSFMAIETGGTLATSYNSSNSAFGRRVRLPVGGDSFDFSLANSNGLLLVQKAVEWAASGGGNLGLIAHYKLEETSGTTANDSSGNGNHGAFVSSPSLGLDAKRGKGAGFLADAAFDRITIPNTVLDGLEQVSVAWWMKTTNTGQQTIVSGAQRLQNNSFLIFFYNNTLFRFLLNGNRVNVPVSSISTGNWIHCVLTLNVVTGDGKFYMNGALAGNFSATGQPGGLQIDTNGLVIAEEQDNVGGGFTTSQSFVGTLDDIRFYDYLLSPEEVGELYGLVGHWKFDETTGTTASDASGSGHDGTLVSSPTWTSDAVRGGALDFEISDGADRVDAGTFSVEGSELTLAAWVWKEQPLDDGRIIIKSINNVGSGQSWGLTVDQDGELDFRVIAGGSWDRVQAPGVIESGAWRHIAGTYDGTTMRLYLDGELIQSKNHKAGGAIVADSGHTVTIGDSIIGDRAFDGKIDDARIYNYALTQSEIAELYGLIGHWKLDETSGSVATDSSKIGNDGNYLNGATLGSAGPYPGAGAVAAEFHGVDEHVGCSPINAYDNVTEYISVATWVCFDTAVASQTQQESVIGRDDWSTKTGFALIADQPNSNGILFRVMDGATNADAIWQSPGIQAGEWHHVVGTYDGSNVKIYIDGELKDTTPFSSALEPYTAGNLNLGYAMDGRMFDARLYNRAISESEIAELYGLIAHWKLDESSGTIAYDSSGMGHDATLTGTQGWTTSSQVDGGFEFDYIDGEEYFTAPSNTMLDDLQEGDYAVTAWFKPNSVPPGTGADNDSSYGVLLKSGWHTGLLYNNGAEMQFDDWLTGGVWNGAGAWNAFAAGKFYHMAGVVCRSEGTVKIYIDGALEETAIFVPGIASYEFGSVPWRIGIGEPGGAAYGYPCDGVIDDARLYSRALSDAEVQAIYQAGLGASGLRIIQWVEAR